MGTSVNNVCQYHMETSEIIFMGIIVSQFCCEL